MLIKRIGHTLIIKTKAYKMLEILAPILMIACILLLGVVPLITEEYKFQEPALRTRLTVLEPGQSKIEYKEIFPGVGLAFIEGRLSRESVLLVSKCTYEGAYQGNEVFANVYAHIMESNKDKKKLMAKNVGFLCCNSSQSIQKFMDYQTGNMDSQQMDPPYLNNKLGIIRNALIIQISPSLSKKKSSSTYLNIYSPGSELHVDVDFYQAIKELLQQVGITKWQPCQEIQEIKLFKGLVRFTIRQWWSFAFKHSLCQLYGVARAEKEDETNFNKVFLQNGVQAATLESYYTDDESELTKKVSKVALSFLEQFVVMEDHLHSSSTIYLPLNQSQFIPLKALIIPGIAFMIAGATHLIIKLVNLFNSAQVKDDQEDEQKRGQVALTVKGQLNPVVALLLLCVYLSSFQFYFNSTILLSLAPLALTRLFIRSGLTPRQKELARIVLAGACIFLCEYCAIFCVPLSIVMILLTLILCFLHKRVILLIGAALISFICLYGEVSFRDFAIKLASLSLYTQIGLYPLLLWVLIV